MDQDVDDEWLEKVIEGPTAALLVLLERKALRESAKKLRDG